ncbi:MAG: fibronectin type III domain-containing protein [Methanomassiliicoccales archaeon]|nr:fibronectin type III domain-containing protein [Methanomassiliicoccales archaeon]
MGTDLMYATNSNGEWETKIVDDVGNVGRFNSIAVDESGGVHISYYDWTNQNLNYATWDGDSWVISIVDSIGVVGEYNSIVCSSGDIFITYLDYSNHDLKVAINTGDGWNTAVVAESVGFGSSLVMNSGVLGVVFTSSDHKLMYAYGNGTDWSTETVDDSSLFGSDMAIDVVDGKSCVAYYDDVSHELKFAVRGTTGIWADEIVDNTTDVRNGPSLDVDSNGVVHISYYDFVNGYLCYAVLDGDWNCSILDDSGGMSSAMVSDYNDKQHIVYIDQAGSTSQLTYITNSGAIWVSETVDESGSAVKTSSIVVDPQGNVHIAYYDTYLEENTTHGRLNYAFSDGNGWIVETVDNSTVMVGQNPYLALDSNGKAHICYYDATSKNLKYATNENGNWINETLVESGDVGMFSAMVIDSNGSLFIAYTNEGSGALKYVNYTSGDLNIGTIDSGLTAMTQISMSLDSNDRVHVAYYRNGALVHSVLTGTLWNPEEIESSNQLGRGISMFIDGQDKVYITYYNTFSKALKYVNNVNGTWNATFIEVSAGVDSAIAVDENGDEHIAYVDNNGILKLAEMRNGIWMFQKVDLSGCGDQISMVMDQQNRVHISYYDPDTMELKYASSLVVPTAPQNFTVDVDDGLLTLNWLPPQSDGGSNITEYRIFRAPAGTSDFELLATVSADSAFYVDSGLTNGVSFDYRIRAVNSEGSSQYASVTGTPCTLPGAPDLGASGRDKSVKLSWDEPSNGGAAIDHYNIYRKNATGYWILIATVDGNETEYTDTGLENGVEYSYKVTAVNPAGEGPESNAATATANPSNDLMIMIIVVVIVIAAVGVGAFILYKRRPKA